MSLKYGSRTVLKGSARKDHTQSGYTFFHLRWEVRHDRLQEVKAVSFVGLGRKQLLENAQNGNDLLVLNDKLRSTVDDRRQESHERGNIALGFPHHRHQNRGNQVLVIVRQGPRGVSLEKSSEKLEDVRHEL